MNPAIWLMFVYIIVTAIVQAIGFGVSKLVDFVDPSWSLMTFLVLFIGAFWIAWPIAVRLTEPKSMKDALEKDLQTLRHSGTIGEFSVTQKKDGAYVRVNTGPNSPPDLRRVIALALQDMITEDRISVIR